MKIEVGEYIRTDTGLIDKVIKNITEDDTFPYDTFDYMGEFVGYSKAEIVKHSKNIIDLIEVGDIVNGCIVVSEKYTYIEMDFINIDSEISYGWGTGAIPENKIKTILTKEQYEQNSYNI